MIIDAVDSDYVIIAMATIERLRRAAPRIFVKRLLLEPGNAAMAASGMAVNPTTSKKRKDGNKENIPPASVASNTATVVKKPRTYEYCDTGMVLNAVRTVLGRRTPDELKPHIVRMLAHMIALCGCDFTRGVSWFNATAVFKNCDVLWPGMCKAATVDKNTGVVVMCPRLVAEGVIGVLWKEVQFKKLCNNPAMKNADFETLFKELSTNTTISAFRRERLVTPMQLCCLVRSANWCCFYWSDPEKTPCSLTGGDYGFTRSSGGGSVQFDDKTPLPVKS